MTAYVGIGKEDVKEDDLQVLAEQVQDQMALLRPDLAPYQQPNLKHETHDPRVYHPYGHPTSFPKLGRPIHPYTSHFHFRYTRRPLQEDIEQMLQVLSQLATVADDCKVTNLEDQKQVQWEYPPVPAIEGYLQWIQDIRDNKYNSIVE